MYVASLDGLIQSRNENLSGAHRCRLVTGRDLFANELEAVFHRTLDPTVNEGTNRGLTSALSSRGSISHDSFEICVAGKATSPSTHVNILAPPGAERLEIALPREQTSQNAGLRAPQSRANA